MVTPGYDIAVICAGLVGLATAHALLGRRPDLRPAVLKQGASGRIPPEQPQLGVLHAGMSYKAGSLTAIVHEWPEGDGQAVFGGADTTVVGTAAG